MKIGLDIDSRIWNGDRKDASNFEHSQAFFEEILRLVISEMFKKVGRVDHINRGVGKGDSFSHIPKEITLSGHVHGKPRRGP